MAAWLVALLAAMAPVAGADIRSSYGGRSNPRYCGYSLERHSVRATDGYITTAFRLPRSNSSAANGQPVLLQHGFLSSSDTWYQIGGNSLSCMLARAGYDVWLANARGNTYSTLHASLHPWNDKRRYWDFSFHEMAVKDLPATIDYIRKVTEKEKLSYIGHSMGGTLDFTLLSEVPEYNKKINVAVTLAPAVYINKYKVSIVDFLPPSLISKILQFLKWFACTVAFIKWPAREVDFFSSKWSTNYDEFMLQTLKTLHYLLYEDGQKRKGSGLDRTSFKTVQHIAQLVCSGTFGKFRYGFYPFLSLTEYNLRNVKTNHFIMYSDGDSLILEEDVRLLCKKLPVNMRECRKVQRRGFGHLDFLASQHAKLHVNDVVLGVLGRHLPPTPTTTTTTTESINPKCLVSK